jgi:hypothetical protein
MDMIVTSHRMKLKEKIEDSEQEMKRKGIISGVLSIEVEMEKNLGGQKCFLFITFNQLIVIERLLLFVVVVVCSITTICNIMR